MKFRFLLTLALSLLLTACDNGDEDGGENISTPITFVASIQPETVTRVTVNNGWTSLADNRMAVVIDGMVKEYVVNDIGEVTSTNPFYWEDREALAVEAWYPYNEGIKPETVIVKADQSISENYVNSDCLEAVIAQVTPQHTELLFTHRVAKIISTVTSSLESVQNPSVVYHPLIGVDEGTSVKATNVYRALLAPQTIPAGAGFIEVRFGTSGNYVYYLEEDLELKAGCLYIAKLTLTPDGIDAVISQGASWTADEEIIDAGDIETGVDNGNGNWTDNEARNETIDGVTPNTDTDRGNDGGWSSSSENDEDLNTGDKDPDMILASGND